MTALSMTMRGGATLGQLIPSASKPSTTFIRAQLSRTGRNRGPRVKACPAFHTGAGKLGGIACIKQSRNKLQARTIR